jgi:hypothetical protein
LCRGRPSGRCARVANAPRSCDENGWITYTNEYKNASARLTLQASQKNKLNIYWDEQDACTNPCYGMISLINSPESYFTLMNRPNRLMQLSWTNPYTNRILLEAGLSTVLTHQDQTKSREWANPRTIPRICEGGSTVGRDEVSTRVNTQGAQSDTNPFGGASGACGVFNVMGSGSLNDGFPGFTPNTLVNDDTYRSRASASYITGSHNVKVGWEGAYFMEKVRNEVNDPRLSYHYNTPNTTGTTWNATTRAGNCRLAVGDPWACGNMTLGIAQGWHDPNDPQNLNWNRPIPIGFQMNTGVGVTDERVWFGAMYLQDQWTINRLTVNGALRYDHAASRYGSSCIGPDVFVAEQWCSEAQDGVNYNDITPRWGVAWDVFGTGKTSVKFNAGKYLQAAGFGGLYTNFNDARRSVNQMTRRWDDMNGNRMVDCVFTDHLAHSSLGDYCGPLITAGTTNPSSTFANFGRPPNSDALNNANSTCGLKNSPQVQVDYCTNAGQDLMNGWDTRRNEWQYGLGIQHEILPRISGEVTYNRRKYSNLTDGDTLNQGCDFFSTVVGEEPAMASTVCAEGWKNYTDPTGLRDFYQITVPVDPRLPNGGGYTIRGLNNQKQLGALPSGSGTVTLQRKDLEYAWNGVDTNFVFRARGGLRISGGTSTGRANRDDCYSDVDVPNVKGRVGNEYRGGCITKEPLRTNVRANGSYTIPWVDVLAGVVFQYRPGPAKSATLSFTNEDIVWEAGSEARTGTPFNGNTATSTGGSVNLLDTNDLFGEGARLTDLTLRKNIRFAGKRVSIGVDVYNLFNSDAATSYSGTYTATRLPDGTWVEDNPNTAIVEYNDWNRVTGIVSPRFARFSLSVDF